MRFLLIVGLFLPQIALADSSYDSNLSVLLANAEDVKVFRSSLLNQMKEYAPLNQVLSALLVEDEDFVQIQTTNRCLPKQSAKDVIECSYVIQRSEDSRMINYIINYEVSIAEELPKLIGNLVSLSRLIN